MIDRAEPATRPPGKIAGYQRWRSLLFMHWPVSVDLLRKAVPAGLEIEVFPLAKADFATRNAFAPEPGVRS